MSPHLRTRINHYLLLLATVLILVLPNLGTPSLWDDDEGMYAEIAREMLTSGHWIIPTLNNQLFTEKPALLYWLIMTAYHVFGISEWSARLPSALAALMTVFATYELARRMFDARTGLVAALVLSCSALFYSSSHFVATDTLLNAFTVLTFLFFWRGVYHQQKSWFIAAGISTGLAVLTKGPIGLILPAMVIALFLLITRQLYRLHDGRLLLGLAAFAITALPWYIAVALETHGVFLREFLINYHSSLFFHAVQNHGEPFYYYLIVSALGFAPWSAFLCPAIHHSVRTIKNRATQEAGAAHVFLSCWIAVYLVFFTLAQTKLPNYIQPIIPALAILTGHFLEEWRQGKIAVSRRAVGFSFLCLLAMGIAVTMAGWVLADDHIDLWFLNGHRYPGLGMLAIPGGMLTAGAALAWWRAGRKPTWAFLAILIVTAMLFDDGLTEWDAGVLDHYKAPRALAEAIKTHQAAPEARIACYQYNQDSLSFYLTAPPFRLHSDEEALRFLNTPSEAYLIMPLNTWKRLKNQFTAPPRLLTMHYDFVERFIDVVVVTNTHTMPQLDEQPTPTTSLPLETTFGKFIYLAIFGFYASGP